jgi:peptide/nickel transport system substrate-binding protein
MIMGLLNWMRKRKSLILGVSMLVGVAMLSGCGGNKGGAGGKTGDTLYIGMTNAPDSFNPLFNPGIAGQFAIRFMYDTLLGMPEPNKFTPQLAESFESQDNQNFTIKINPKAKWTDGTPVTAADVVYTLNLIANPKVETSKGTYINMLEGVDDKGKLVSGDAIPGLAAKDEKTVVFKTKAPVDPNYLKSMLGFEVYIVPKHVFEKIDPAAIANSEAATKPTVTSGAYKFVAYVTNDHVEYAANEDYYKGAPKLKKLFIRVMNGTNLVTELKSGNVQLAAGGGIGVIPVKDLDVLKKDSKLIVKTAPSFAGQYLEVNNSNPMFNVKFRRAVTMAINRKQLVDQLYKGTAQVVPTVYTMASPVYDKSVEPLPYDPAKAKEELAASGFDTSKELTLQVPLGNVLREQSADLIQQDLKAIGLNVKQQKLDFPTVLGNAKKGDYELLLLGYGLTADPDYSSYFIPGGSSNFAHTDDPTLTDMMLKAAAMTSADQRKTAYVEIQKYMRDNQFVTSLYETDYIMAQSKNLKGGIKDFWEGSLDDINEWHFE